MIDAAVLEILVEDCVYREGVSETMYLDSKGYVTVGIGQKLNAADEATRLPFVGNHIPATRTDIIVDYWRVAKMDAGHSAHSYSVPESPRLPAHRARQLCSQRVKGEFLPALRALSLDVDAFPTPAVRALVAMAYCMGPHGLSGFPRMLSRCRMLDFTGAALQCDMKGARNETNARHERWFQQAAQEVRDAKRTG